MGEEGLRRAAAGCRGLRHGGARFAEKQADLYCPTKGQRAALETLSRDAIALLDHWARIGDMGSVVLVSLATKPPAFLLVVLVVIAVAMLAISVAVVAAGVFVSSPGVEGTWSDAAPLIAQSAVNLTAGMVVGVALGAILLAGAYALGTVNRWREGGWASALYAPSGVAGTAAG